MMKKEGNVSVILHNIRSAYNVGSIFRTADAIGVTKIYLSGYTPCPIDRFGRSEKQIAKTALGAEISIPWEYLKTPNALLKRLKKEGVLLVGLEQDKRAIDYKTFTPKYPIIFLVGNEVRGLSPALSGTCDVLLEIPMRGIKESLNVSVAFGIALYRIIDR